MLQTAVSVGIGGIVAASSLLANALCQRKTQQPAARRAHGHRVADFGRWRISPELNFSKGGDVMRTTVRIGSGVVVVLLLWRHSGANAFGAEQDMTSEIRQSTSGDRNGYQAARLFADFDGDSLTDLVSLQDSNATFGQRRYVYCGGGHTDGDMMRCVTAERTTATVGSPLLGCRAAWLARLNT
jgi:hypothetical protein